MSMRRYITAAAGLTLALGIGACDNDKLTRLNVNPNEPTDVPPEPLFTSAVRTSVRRYLDNWYDLRVTSLFIQHLAAVQYPDEDQYSRISGSDMQSWFENPYFVELLDLHRVEQKGTAQNRPGVSAPASIMKMWVFGYLTDTYGDVPFSEALKGDEGNLTPKYDAQKDIYAAFFTTLAKATTDLAGAAGRPGLGGADPIYGGNAAAWQRFSNSLRARYAMRIVNVDPTLASAQLTAAFGATGGVIDANSENAELHWPGDGLNDSPWSDNFEGRDDHRMSRTLMDIMLANSDPRVPIFAQPTKANPAVYRGMPNGLSADSATKWFDIASRPGLVFFPTSTSYGTFNGTGATQPSYLMTAAEMLFTKAEAAERSLGGLTPAQAPGFYVQAITASLEQWGVASGAITTYLAQPGVVYTPGVAGLRQIAVQKWIALFTDGGQAWFEWRRTCQPNTIVPGPEAALAAVPRRLEYTPTEYAVNKPNVDAAIARQGPDNHLTRVYWDKMPSGAPTCS